MRKLVVFFLFLSVSAAVFGEGRTITLETAVEMAVSNNLQAEASAQRVMQAEYERRAASTLFLPRISSSFGYTRLSEAQFTGENLYTLGLALTQPLYTGGRLRSVYAQAREHVKMAGFEKDAVIQDLISDTKKGYFSILKAERVFQTANRMKELAQEHLRTASAFFEEGLATRAEVLKTEVYLAEINQQIVQAENAIALAKAGFSFLLNRHLSEEFEVEDVFEKRKEKNSLEYWTELSYERRPELKALESAGRIYEYGITAEKSGYKPQVALFSGYSWDRGTEMPFDEWKDSWNIGVSVELDIWNWGETGHRVQKAVHAKKEIESRLALLRKAVELEVKTAYLNLETAEKQTEAIKKSLETAEENLRVTNLLYREGMTATAEVIDAQTGLSSAMNNYYQSLYDYQIAYAGLERASGGLD
ncbi:MAG: TolC family protein [Candidatus Omnitrophica bacterium]|nr:TolC family protein [Candidatus Omnitrophota bacterium]